MPFATRRLDLLLVPDDPNRVLDEDLLARLAVAGLCTETGEDRDAAGLPAFARLRLDLPDGPVLYGNQAGGIRVRCPDSQRPAARELDRAMARWRRGEDAAVHCVCGERHAIAELDFAPPAAPGRSALVVVDAGAYLLDDPARSVLAEHLGPFRLIPRRVS